MPRSALRVVETAIPAVRLIEPTRHGDARGFFSEVYSRQAFSAAGIDLEFVQDNHAMSEERHTVRGLHFQVHPAVQAKLVRVTRGAIFDVAVDLRPASATYGRHVAAELSADNWRQLLVPVGFAHGYCTLEPRTEVLYKVTAPYAPEHERGIRWDDPDLGIPWPAKRPGAVVSEKDGSLPRLAEATGPFRFGD